jgi:hypothetical protein
MTQYYCRSRPTVTWATGHAYSLGDKVIATSSTTKQGYCFECTTAGTSHASTEPTWNTTLGGTVVDNTVTWTTRGGAQKWQASLAYVAGERVTRVNVSTGTYNGGSAGGVWECTVGGTSNSTEPAWPSSPTDNSTTQTDNTVTWKFHKCTSWDNCGPNLGAILQGAGSGIAGGDTVYVSKTHAENNTANTSTIVLTAPGNETTGGAVKVLCIDDTGMPTSGFTLATGAVIKCTGTTSDVTVAGFGYYYGITFESDSRTVFVVGAGTLAGVILENCLLWLNHANSGADVVIGTSATSSSDVLLINTQVKFGAAGHAVALYGGRVKWRDTAPAVALGTSPTNLFSNGTHLTGAASFEGENLDFSNLTGGGSTGILGSLNLLGVGHRMIFRDCKMPTSFQYADGAGAIDRVGAAIADFVNCDSGNTNYRVHREHPFGTLDEELTLIKASGATDGTTPISWKLVSRATAQSNGGWPFALASFPIVFWNDNSGGSKTATVEILVDSASNWNNDDIWLELGYPAGSSDTLGGKATSNKASIVASNAALTSSGASWTTTGMTHPNAQKLSVSFTPGKKGWIRGTVHLAKANVTAYVDPVLKVS